MGNFKEFTSFKQVERYMENKGTPLIKGSKERKNLQYIYVLSEREGRAVGILRIMCPCGYVGDGDQIRSVDRQSKEYKEYTETGNTPTVFCTSCIVMSNALVIFGLDAKTAHKALELLWDIKRGDA